MDMWPEAANERACLSGLLFRERANKQQRTGKIGVDTRHYYSVRRGNFRALGKARDMGGRVRLGGSGTGKWVLGLKHGARFQV